MRVDPSPQKDIWSLFNLKGEILARYNYSPARHRLRDMDRPPVLQPRQRIRIRHTPNLNHYRGRGRRWSKWYILWQLLQRESRGGRGMLGREGIGMDPVGG